MERQAEFRLTVPIVRFYDDPEDEDRFFIEGLASDTSIDKSEGAMEGTAIYEMAGDFANGIVVDVEHNHGWADEIGDVEEAVVLDKAPADFPNASPPILWTKLKVDKLLSHGKDLYYLLKKGVNLGLSIEGFMNKFTFDEDEILRRVSVTWKRLAVTRTPANENAWLSNMVLSAQSSIQEGGDPFDFGTGSDSTSDFSIRMIGNPQEEPMTVDGTPPEGEPPDEEGLELGRIFDAISGLSDNVVALGEGLENIDGRLQVLESVEPPEPQEPPESEGDPEQVDLSAIMDRLDGLDERISQVGQTTQRRSGEELLNLAIRRRSASARRGMAVGDFQVNQEQDLDEQYQLAIEDGDIDRAKGVFWHRLDVQRGLVA